ncbi:MAG: glycine--tRNA ligase subunit beta [Myxococcota bacterium]
MSEVQNKSALFIALRCEELPARFVELAQNELTKSILNLLKGISHGQSQSWASPRHLGVEILNVEGQTPLVEQLVTGPPVSRAFKDGAPTKAAIGFARGKGVSVESLETVDSPKGPVIAARITRGGESTITRIKMGLEEAILGIPFPKSMKWGNAEYSWARPLQGVSVLFGNEPIDVTVAGISSTSSTLGHRLNPGPIPFNSADSWLSGLRAHQVEPDTNVRRERIVEQLKSLADAHQLSLGELTLIDEVVHLVEWPVTIAGQFPKELLELPPKLLVESMRVHQRVFPSYTADGKLSSTFFAVTNQPNARDEEVKAIIANGNKRVLTARFYDAKFFYAEDRKKNLIEHGKKLAKVRWVRNGGTLADKAERIATLAREWAHAYGGDPQAAYRAGLICKADLCTQMVGEFPSLQGHVGKLLAEFDGESKEVSMAVEGHYFPRFHGDKLPESRTALLVGLADRWDTLTNCFRLGLAPKGSGDPLGLRRAANGFLLLGQHGEIPFKLKSLVHGAELDDALYQFLIARLRAQLQEEAPTDFVNAVLATDTDNPLELEAKLHALQNISKQDDFGDFRACFKRVLGLSKDHKETTINTDHFEHSSEKALHEATLKSLQTVSEAGTDYNAAFAAMAELRPYVNDFFESVMVMVDDEQIRRNRLSLLRSIANGFRQLADFRLLSTDAI